MDVAVDAKAFRDAVAWTARWVPSRPENPAWTGLRLTADGDDLTLVVFDGDTTAVVSIAADVRTGGDVATSGRLLGALAATLPARVPVVVSSTGTKLVLTAGTVVATLPLMPAIMRVPDPPPSVGMIDTQAFAEAVKRVAPVTSRKRYDDDFTQIRLGFEDDHFELMAMDGRRAAWAYGAATVLRFDTAVTVTAKALAEAVSTFDSSEITVGADHSQASFSGSRCSLVMRQWGKPYRENIVRTVLGRNPDTYAVVPTKPLSEALKRAVLTRTEMEPTALEWSAGQLVVTACSDANVTVGDTLAVEYDGPAHRILVNPVLLGEALACVGGERTSIAFEPASPALPLRITDPDDEEYLHVLAPIRP